MASFPGSVKTFVSRNAGDILQPAHINDLQDEVNAVESGYLNGSAPLNSSNSTMFHISALAGMNIVGNSTLGSTVTLGTVTYVFPAAAPTAIGQALTAQSTGSTSILQWGSAVGIALLAHNDTEGTTVSSAAYTSLSTVSGFSVDSNTTLIVEFGARSAGASGGAGLRVQVNGSVTIHQNSTATATIGGNNSPFSNAAASHGFFHLELGPRDANYDRMVSGYAQVFDSTGTVTTPAITMGFGASTFTGAVTSVEVAAKSNGGVTIGINHLKVYSKAGA